MRKFFARIWKWFCGWFGRKSVRYKPIYIEELPDELESDAIYIAGEGKYLWFAAMICPCGCGATLHMNLQTDTRPRWSVECHSDETVSFSPSIWRKIGCRSHFFLRNGQVVWCHDRETSPVDDFTDDPCSGQRPR